MASVGIEQTIVGNVGNVYELRRVGQEKRAVIDFSIAVTPRTQNYTTKEWEDGQTTWVNCTAWDRLAENIEKSFGKAKDGKASRVIVKGRIKTKPEFTKEDGTVIPPRDFLNVEYAGPEIFFDPAVPVREERSNSGNSNASAPAEKSRPAARTEAPKKAAPKKDESLDDLDFDLDGQTPW